MAGWKKAQRHIKYAASSSSLYGRFYHTILLGTDLLITPWFCLHGVCSTAHDSPDGSIRKSLVAALRVTIIFVLSRKLFDKRIEQDIECDTKVWFIHSMNLPR